MINKNNKLILFEDNQIRRIWHDDEWCFSVVDIIAALSGSSNPRDYWYKMKVRVKEEDGFEPSTVCRQLKMKAPDGKMRATDCSNTEGVLRILQSIPSPKAEPFKLWMAQVGYERIQEIENPGLAQERMKALYEKKGYSQDWIDKRIRSIAIRQNLTDEWQERGVDNQKDFSILTAEISKNEKPKTFPDNKKVAKRGGSVSGKARKDTEKELGRSVVSKENYLKAGNLNRIE